MSRTNCANPVCPDRRQLAYAVVREPSLGTRPPTYGLAVCETCLESFAERRDGGESIRIHWL